MMWNFLRKSSDAAVDPRDARIKELEANELKLKQRFGRKVEEADRARRVAAQRSEEIHKLEERVAHQSSNITSLCNEIASLKRELRPFRAPRPRGPNGWYLSDAQIAAHNHHVSQVMDSMTQVQS